MAAWLDGTLDARPAVYLVWIVVSLLAIPMYTMSPRSWPLKKIRASFRHRRCGGQFHPRPDQPLHSRGQRYFFMSFPETEFLLPDHLSQFRLCRHGGQALG
jgi:hypothetical protein